MLGPYLADGHKPDAKITEHMFKSSHESWVGKWQIKAMEITLKCNA